MTHWPPRNVHVVRTRCFEDGKDRLECERDAPVAQQSPVSAGCAINPLFRA